MTYKQLEAYFDILKPSKDILERTITRRLETNQDETVFHKEDDYNRILFYTTRDLANFTKDENTFLEQFEKIGRELNLPVWWRTGDTLRFGHAVFLNLENTKAVKFVKQLVTNYLRYIHKVKEKIKLSQETLGFIGSGNLYILGKCKQESTNVYLTFNPKIASAELEEFLGLLKFIFLLVRNSTCVPGYQERFNIVLSFLDCRSSIPFIANLLKALAFILEKYFPYCVNRVIFLGNLEKLGSEYREFKGSTAGKMCSVTHIPEAVMQKELRKYIDENQFEKKFGGAMENVVEFWPPRPHTPPGECLDEEMLGEKSCIPFYIYDEDFHRFKVEHLKYVLDIGPRELKIAANAIPTKGRSRFISR